MAQGAGMGCGLPSGDGVIRSPLKRSVVRIKARRSKPRRVGVLRDQRYMDWLHEICRCLVCVPGVRLQGWEFLTIDPAHTENNGMRSKGADSSCVPLCRHHHREYDAGRAAFELKYGIDMKREAAAHYALWLIVRES